MKILDLIEADTSTIAQMSNLLVIGFSGHAWPDEATALQEVRDFFTPERICRIAVDEEGMVLGWIGGILQYDGNAWELHPLIVHPDYQGQGIGRALVHDFERIVYERGGVTIYLGTDDEDHSTSLGMIDLYPDVFAHIAQIENLQRHPYEFYLKLGFTIVGVIPDANGFGKPDILMAKRVSGHTGRGE
ncbi:MAG: GNAT family N-acetyltransferase [Anaerolineales bacterium]|nr:GNAT family N-acetyltransferase [Anaerolineales bacterium]MCA9928226.1 GNAT family N-acetyltransferase [Anaerolineales bacterium]